MFLRLKEGLSDGEDNATTCIHILIFCVLVVLVITSAMRICIYNKFTGDNLTTAKPTEVKN